DLSIAGPSGSGVEKVHARDQGTLGRKTLPAVKKKKCVGEKNNNTSSCPGGSKITNSKTRKKDAHHSLLLRKLPKSLLSRCRPRKNQAHRFRRRNADGEGVSVSDSIHNSDVAPS
ncbi:hypothetical protein A2U01_0063898, partial [Trifolium medium]|nr:hypothetical protein [Trifolium medium]